MSEVQQTCPHLNGHTVLIWRRRNDHIAKADIDLDRQTCARSLDFQHDTDALVGVMLPHLVYPDTVGQEECVLLPGGIDGRVAKQRGQYGRHHRERDSLE